MASISCARPSLVYLEEDRVHLNAPAAVISYGDIRKGMQLLFVVLGAASLAACAQSSVVSQKPPSLEHPRTTSVITNRHYGVASFYKEGTRTANGESFDTHQLTAAHRTLPFGTRLRVTNLATGRSVTVRVNDRGPFIPGRVVDVSYSAAEKLGMIGRGIAQVKLDVVQ
jgi:rare lipoprotein A